MQPEPQHPIGLIGLGAYLPERVMTNDEWAEHVDTSDEWITSRTGIKRRHIIAEDQSTLELALEAARSALDDAGLSAQDLDEIIVATDTPEMPAPDTAAFVQHELGAREIPAFDLAGSGCAGFLLALDVARARILLHGGLVLVIGAEALTKWLSWKDRHTDVLFGDGAGAAIVGRREGAAEILGALAGTDGSKADILAVPVGGTRHRITAELVAQGLHEKAVMKGRELFKEAVSRMTAASQQVLEQAGKSLDEVDLFVPHQANLRIIQAVGQKLGIAPEKVAINIQDVGNTGSASVPIALWEARRQGRVKPGDLVLCTSFGAGFHWAAVLLQY